MWRRRAPWHLTPPADAFTAACAPLLMCITVVSKVTATTSQILLACYTSACSGKGNRKAGLRDVHIRTWACLDKHGWDLPWTEGAVRSRRQIRPFGPRSPLTFWLWDGIPFFLWLLSSSRKLHIEQFTHSQLQSNLPKKVKIIFRWIRSEGGTSCNVFVFHVLMEIKDSREVWMNLTWFNEVNMDLFRSTYVYKTQRGW